VCDVLAGRGGTWSRSDVIVFSPAAEGPLFRVSAAGGEPVAVTALDSLHESAHRFPCFLPDGEHFLYTALPAGLHGFEVYVGSLSSRKAVRLMTANSSVVYAAPGYLLFASQGQLVAQPFDARRRQLRGEPIAIAPATVTADLEADLPVSESKQGRLLQLGRSVPNTRLQWMDRRGGFGAVVHLPAGRWELGQIAPDGVRAVVMNGGNLWLVDLVRGYVTRLTTGPANDYGPVWSPDGSRIAFTSNRAGREEIFVVSAAGGDPVQLETCTNLFKHALDWCGEWLLFCTLSHATDWDLWALRMGGNGAAFPVVAGPFVENAGSLSPDTRWLAYLSNESGSYETCVQSFPRAGITRRVSVGGASAVGWVKTGRELLYLNRNALFSVPVTPGVDLRMADPRVLFTFPVVAGIGGASVTADGERILVAVPVGDERRSLQLVLDWPALLSR